MVNVTVPGSLAEACWVNVPNKRNNIARIDSILGENLRFSIVMVSLGRMNEVFMDADL